MAITLVGQVTGLPDGQPLAGVSVRLVAPLAALEGVLEARPFDESTWSWTYQVTGIAGVRWEIWERFLKDAVPGLNWDQFRTASLTINPVLQTDFTFHAEETYLLPEPSASPTFTWTRQLTGFAGNRWECWERFLKDQVAGLRWNMFSASSLFVNPVLQSDHLFKADQTYLIPELSSVPQGCIDTITDSNGGYQFSLNDAPVVVTLSASSPGLSGSIALRIEGATTYQLALAPVAPSALGAAAFKRPAPSPDPIATNGSMRSTRPDYGTLPALARRTIDQALFMLGDDAATFDALPAKYKHMCYGAVFLTKPQDLNYKDICCADLVSVSLAAAGLDIAWSAHGGNTRMADYYHPRNGDGKLIEISDPNDYLPGDVFVFGNGDRESRAEHVALYVGPFEGSDRSGHSYPATKQCVVVEGSLDSIRKGTESGTAVRGIPLQSCLNGEYGTFSWVRRVRLHQLAQAFGR